MLPFTLPDGRQVIVVLREQLPEAVQRLIDADAEPAPGVVEGLLAKIIERKLGPAPRPDGGKFDSSSSSVVFDIAHEAERARERREQRRERRQAPKQYQPRKRKEQYPRCPRCAKCPCARGFDPLTYNPMDEPNAIHDMASRWSKEQAAKRRAEEQQAAKERVERIRNPSAGVGQAFQPADEVAELRPERGADKDVRPTSAEKSVPPAGRDVERGAMSPTDSAALGTSQPRPESPSKPEKFSDGLQIRPTARGDPER